MHRHLCLHAWHTVADCTTTHIWFISVPRSVCTLHGVEGVFSTCVGDGPTARMYMVTTHVSMRRGPWKGTMQHLVWRQA
jgi:hypothetical protein